MEKIIATEKKINSRWYILNRRYLNLNTPDTSWESTVEKSKSLDFLLGDEIPLFLKSVGKV